MAGPFGHDLAVISWANARSVVYQSDIPDGKKPATDQARQEAEDQFRFLEYVVAEEDYATGIAQHEICDPAKSHVLFGKNELGGQQFHAWVDRIIDASDDELLVYSPIADAPAVTSQVDAN